MPAGPTCPIRGQLGQTYDFWLSRRLLLSLLSRSRFSAVALPDPWAARANLRLLAEPPALTQPAQPLTLLGRRRGSARLELFRGQARNSALQVRLKRPLGRIRAIRRGSARLELFRGQARNSALQVRLKRPLGRIRAIRPGVRGDALRVGQALGRRRGVRVGRGCGRRGTRCRVFAGTRFGWGRRWEGGAGSGWVGGVGGGAPVARILPGGRSPGTGRSRKGQGTTH